jgi:hypothetical protein
LPSGNSLGEKRKAKKEKEERKKKNCNERGGEGKTGA